MPEPVTATAQTSGENERDLQAIPLPDLTLVPASKAQIHESHNRTWTMWGRGLPKENFMERISKMYEHQTATDGKAVTW